MTMSDYKVYVSQDVEQIESNSRNDQACAVAIGFFDGVHRGHKAVIRRLIDVARDYSLPPAVVCLIPPGHFYKRLCTLEDCFNMILDLGVEIILPMPWSGSSPFGFSVSTPVSTKETTVSQSDSCDQDAIDDIHALLEQIGAQVFVTGNSGKQTPEGLKTVTVETVTHDGLPVTTDRILKALQSGKMEDVQALLGRTHYYYGRVIPGARRGRTVDMPTANITVAPRLQLPAFGVYATKIKVRNRWYESLTNIGNRPTVDTSEKVTIETHILDFNDAIYGEEVKLEIYSYIRPTFKFDSIVDVRDQVKRDIVVADTKRSREQSD